MREKGFIYSSVQCECSFHSFPQWPGLGLGTMHAVQRCSVNIVCGLSLAIDSVGTVNWWWGHCPLAHTVPTAIACLGSIQPCMKVHSCTAWL